MTDIKVDTPWSSAATVLDDLIDKLVPDKNAAAAAKAAAADRLGQQLISQLNASVAVDQAQAATNTAEAQSTRVWNSGWRPYIGWCSGTGLVYAILLQPLLTWLTGNLLGWKPAPVIDVSILITVLLAMLGVSTQRTIERINGVIPPGK